MKIKKLVYQYKPPCSKCPYKLGKIRAVANPCPQCELNGYQSYEWFQKQLLKENSGIEN